MKTLWLLFLGMLLGACMAGTGPADETLDETPSWQDLIPMNLTVTPVDDDEALITWDAVDGALHYVLNICINEFVVTDTYHVMTTEPDHIYALRIKAVFDEGESVFSKVVSTHTFKVLDVASGTHTRFSQDVVTLTIPDEAAIIDVHTTHVPLSIHAYTVQGNTITLNKPFLDQLCIGTHFVVVSTCCGHFLLEIESLPPVVPHVQGPSVVTYTSGADVSFDFNLMHGTITTVTASGLTVEDYVISGNTLIILSSYIESRIDQVTDLTLILVSYQITYQGGTIVGTVIINLRS